jgi:hypothetical protein
VTTKNRSSSKKFLFYFGFPFIAKPVFAAIGGTLHKELEKICITKNANGSHI